MSLTFIFHSESRDGVLTGPMMVPRFVPPNEHGLSGRLRFPAKTSQRLSDIGRLAATREKVRRARKLCSSFVIITSRGPR